MKDTCLAACRRRGIARVVPHYHTWSEGHHLPRRRAKVDAGHLVMPLGYAAYAVSSKLALLVAIGYTLMAIFQAYDIKI